MGVIVPTILTTSLEDIKAKLALVEGRVESVQIDVVDGQYAGPPTWPYVTGVDGLSIYERSGASLSDLGNFRFELDLMVSNPEDTVGTWIRLGAERVLIHLESTKNVGAILDTLEREYGYTPGFAPGLLSVGLAIQIDTDLAALAPYAKRIEYVQFMGIATIGKQGQPFDPRVLEKMKAFRQLYPELLMQVDGAVSLETAPALLAAGANRLVIGSALWKSGDVPGTLTKLEELVETYGRYA